MKVQIELTISGEFDDTIFEDEQEYIIQQMLDLVARGQEDSYKISITEL